MRFPELVPRLARLRLLVFDVDGVLTDGSLGSGQTPARRWDVRDGFGFALARRANLSLAFCSGYDDQDIRDRAARMGIGMLRLGVTDKRKSMEEILIRTGRVPEETLFAGDELFDLPGLYVAGVSAAPADARQEVLERVDWPLRTTGGHGCAREIIEEVLKARGEWDALVGPYLKARNG